MAFGINTAARPDPKPINALPESGRADQPYGSDDDIYALEAKYGIPHGLYLAVLQKGEKSGEDAVSPKGAIGRAQLMPDTAREMGIDPRDPRQNLEGGAMYLAKMYKHAGGDKSKAVGFYNAGPAGNLNNPETAKYIANVMGTSQGPSPGLQDEALGPIASLPGGPNDPHTQELQKKGMEALEHSLSVDREVEKGLGEDFQTYRKLLEEGPPKIPPPPTLDEKAFPPTVKADDYIKNPMRVLGSALPVLAILGGLMTRRGAINALAAASGAMKGVQEGDKEAYDRAHQQWKDSMEETLDHWKVQSEQYRDALENTRMSMDERVAQLQVQAAMSQNRQMQAAVANGEFGEIYKMIQQGDAMWWKGMQVLSTAQYHDRLIDARNRSIDAMLEKMPGATQAFYARRQQLMADGSMDENEATVQALKDVAVAQSPNKAGQVGREEERLINADKAVQVYKNVQPYMVKLGNMSERDFQTGPGQARILDTFTRLATNQAVRQFMADIAHKYAGPANQAERAFKSWTGTDAPIMAEAQAKEFYRQAQEMAGEIQDSYDQTLASHARRIEQRGGDPLDAIDEEDIKRLEKKKLLGGVAVATTSRKPPPAAVQELRSHDTPERRKQFDEVFGEGAAESALGG